MHGCIAAPDGFSSAPAGPDALSLIVECGNQHRFFSHDALCRCRDTSVRAVLHFSVYRPVPLFLMRKRIKQAFAGVSSLSGIQRTMVFFQLVVRAKRGLFPPARSLLHDCQPDAAYSVVFADDGTHNGAGGGRQLAERGHQQYPSGGNDPFQLTLDSIRLPVPFRRTAVGWIIFFQCLPAKATLKTRRVLRRRRRRESAENHVFQPVILQKQQYNIF
jgi:hypothetical protein